MISRYLGGARHSGKTVRRASAAAEPTTHQRLWLGDRIRTQKAHAAAKTGLSPTTTMPEAPSAGTLTLVAAPIGNLADISARAIEVLRDASTIACEDTRVTGKLLQKLDIAPVAKLISYREENESHMAATLSARLAAGDNIALIADAGTPAISDPGFRLVRECRKRGLPVTTAPGVSAVTTALSLSGLPSDRFLYAGFLPPKSAARKRLCESQKSRDCTIRIYETCPRIGKCLNDLVDTHRAEPRSF